MTRITEGLVGCMLSSMVLECIGPIVAGCVWVLGMKVMAWGPTLDVARADSGTRIGADAGIDFFANSALGAIVDQDVLVVVRKDRAIAGAALGNV